MKMPKTTLIRWNNWAIEPGFPHLHWTRLKFNFTFHHRMLINSNLVEQT